MREGVTRTARAGAADAGAARRRRRRRLGLSHFEHHLEEGNEILVWHVDANVLHAERRRPYLVIDGGAELNQQEAVGDHRKDTQSGGEEDGQPDVGLVEGVSCCSCKVTHTHSRLQTRFLVSNL